jgi:hypothetical protein
MALNLTRAAATITGARRLTRATTATVRRTLITVPRLVSALTIRCEPLGVSSRRLPRVLEAALVGYWSRRLMVGRSTLNLNRPVRCRV